MAGFVPGRDRAVIEALNPDATERSRAAEDAHLRAALDKEELASLERGGRAGDQPHLPKRTHLDRLLRRR